MDPLLQLFVLLAGFGLYAWADRHRLISLARPYLAPLQRAYATLHQDIRPAKAPQAYVSPNRALLSDGRRWLLVGAPGSGKSTAARQLIRAYHDAGVQVLILDPEGAMWPEGARIVGAGDDYPAMQVELEQLARLARVRRLAFHQGRRDFDPLLLLIDEAPAVLRSTPGALEIVADLARRGRKLAISIILLSQDTQAKTLGIKGQTRLLDAFERFDCRMTPAGVALLKEGVVQQVAPLDYHLTDLVLPVIAELRPSTPDADRLLERALSEPVPEQKQGAFPAVLPPSTGTSSAGSELVPADTDAVPGGFDDEVIRTLATAGWSRNKIATKIGGRRTDALTKVRAALGDG